jgi:hypothetical protein
MTYTFKLSRRMAIAYCVPMLLIALTGILGCSPSEPTAATDSEFSAYDTDLGDPVLRGESDKPGKGHGRDRRLVKLVVTPDPATIAVGSSKRFTASAKLSDGSAVDVKVTWSASGGTIDSSGLYTADSAGAYRVFARNESLQLADTASVTAGSQQASVTAVTLSPASVTLSPGSTQRFAATAKLSDGSTSPAEVTYSATGGSVTQDGVYTAGTTGGAFRVIAKQSGGTLADTTAVTISETSTSPPPTGSPSVTAITLSPASVTLSPGGIQRMTATAKLSDGATSPANVTYQATGGSITSDGLYTAGQTAGTFRVIAMQSGGPLADTAVVTVTAPTAPSSGTTYELATAETAGNIAPFEYALTHSPCSPTPHSSADRAKHGSRSWKIELFPCGSGGQDQGFLDTGPTTSMGDPNRRFNSGWYSWYTYVDAGFSEPAEQGNWNMLLGWMTSNDAGATVQPISHMGLEVWNGMLQVVYVLKNCSVRLYTCPPISDYQQSNGGGWYRMTASSPAGIKPFPRNQWVHLAVYYDMRASNGHVIIYQDGQKIMDLTAPTMNTLGGTDGLKNLGNNMILQYHIYENSRAATQRIYLDDFRVSDYRPAP